MRSPFSSAAFRTLFIAQICALLAVGLLTVALSLRAYAVGGVVAGGQVLSLLLTLKMVAYVVLAPLAEVVLAGRSRKAVMIALDVGRLGLLVLMPVATELWQIAVLAFAFFALSAAFTPLFQSVIPDLLPEEDIYTRALALSRIAYTVEAFASPVIAATLLVVLAPGSLFLGAAAALAVSVAALIATRFPHDAAHATGPFVARAMRGMSIYLHTPRLRGLLMLNIALALAMAWVLVNSVIYAERFGAAERYFPFLMAAYGFGSAIGAVMVPGLVARIGERRVMVLGAFGFAATGAVVLAALPLMGSLGVWGVFGLTSSLVLTPGGLVIARSADTNDRPAVFAAQFSLSHAGWLLAYPLAGWLAVALGLAEAMAALSALCAALTLLALRVWPADEPATLPHSHPELPPDHPHLKEHPTNGRTHTHTYHINALHPRWADDLSR